VTENGYSFTYGRNGTLLYLPEDLHKIHIFKKTNALPNLSEHSILFTVPVGHHLFVKKEEKFVTEI